MTVPSNGSSDGSWDPGLQSERTGLAWQRTLLSGLACSLLVSRLLSAVSVVLALTAGLLALLSTAVLGWWSVTRYRRQDAAIRAGHPIGDGWPSLLLSGLVVVTALGALVYVLAV